MKINKIILLSSLLICACSSNNSSISTTNSLASSSSTTKISYPEEPPLYYFLGSSVTYGHTTGGKSFVEYLKLKVNCETVKSAVSGTTLVDNGSSSYVQRLLRQLEADAEVEHLVVQLSTNDAIQNKPLGEINAENDYDFDTSTITGAIEYIISYAYDVWECGVTFYTNPYYDNKTYENMINRLYEIQEKWDIGIVDFYYYQDMEELDSATLKKYMSDSIHPNLAGYNWMSDIFKNYLINLYEENHPNYTLEILN